MKDQQTGTRGDYINTLTIYLDKDTLSQDLIKAAEKIGVDFNCKIEDASVIDFNHLQFDYKKLSTLISGDTKKLISWVRKNGKSISYGNVIGKDGYWCGLILEKAKTEDYYYEKIKSMCHLYGAH